MGKVNQIQRDQPFDNIDDVIDALRRGELVIVTDDEKRENEGDLICAAEKVTSETINFMVTHGRGLICVSMEQDQLIQLGLSRMVSRGDDAFRTAFMESVDANDGVTTGISAFDRAQTIKVLIDEKSTPHDITSPGHIFPLEAKKGGVLRRAGHTEAATDLARLAGFKSAGVICEIIRDDGNMARLPDLISFAQKHNLKITSVADLVAYRQQHEKLIKLEGTTQLPTDFGTFDLKMYHSFLDQTHHLVLTMGDPVHQDAPLVRVHSECLTGDVFGSLRCDCGSQLQAALGRISQEGHGVIVYMKQEGRGIGLANKIHAYALQDKGFDTVEANKQLGLDADLRDYGISAQILNDLGLKRIQLITNNPQKIAGLERYGIEVTKRIPIKLPNTPHNERYLETKKSKMGHLL
ncbi:MAG: bifunctional 3,4-dihydroxy-2-butanone-4-phosphate synthase/GTP cyclohydrolase II [Kiritimatiellae bacterium]|nr:bifunctional 3,4-dihydroxy-2-butanone-4-phosphate synthase/GTP cyclohydrolase II [Kiritimatiellia bacterium]